MRKIFVVAFLILLGVHLYAGSFSFPVLAFFTKPLLLISLIVFFLIYTRGARRNLFRNLIFLGLVFSLSGDVFLMFQDSDGSYFTAGLVSFLIAHIFYIWAFSKTYLKNHNIPIIKRQGWVMVLIVAYGYLFYKALEDFLGKMVGPVILYTAVITLMLLIAVNRFERVSRYSFWFIAIGAALFVASDSILAWNKFRAPLPYSHFQIMATYGLAQLFIVLGAARQVEEGVLKSLKDERRAINKNQIIKQV